jgi:D-alanine-D-alanine ligase
MLGHEVTPVEVSVPIEELVARLRLLQPDLVFNIAEGTHGRFREAFYPALFEQLKLRCTGSSASVLALCLDKALAKRIVAAAGLRVPEGWFVESLADLPTGVEPPLIVKPNFEGASKGITHASVVTELRDLEPTVARVLAQYPGGVLVERYIDGDDATVAWVESLGILSPILYVYPRHTALRIYDLAWKHGGALGVELIEAPMLAEAGRRAFAALGVSGYGRADFRIAADGTIYFLEMNPLPSLADGDKELYLAATRRGLTELDLIAAIVAPAVPW